jgi:hypothetical protein
MQMQERLTNREWGGAVTWSGGDAGGSRGDRGGGDAGDC